jgi:acetyltransferase-like isoleucine patch superfamily enzyme
MFNTEKQNPLETSSGVSSSIERRYQIKRLAVYMMFLLTWPFSLASWLSYRILGSEGVFDFSAKLLSLVPGLPGQYLRTSFYMVTLRKCHYDLLVGFGSFFSHPDATVGRRVGLGAYSIVGSVDIEPDVLISSRVSIISGKYQHGGGLRNNLDWRSAVPRFERIRIGHGCWIGEGAVVMANLGARSIVSAGSVVTKHSPEEVMAIGNPARFIKIGDFSNA